MIIDKKLVFQITFFITLLARCFTWYSSTIIPYTAIYIVFIVFWGVLMVLESSFSSDKLRTPFAFIILGLALYFVIWGLSNIKDLDLKDTMDVMLRSLQMIAFILVSSYWIRRYNMLFNIIRIGYFTITLLMVISFIVSIKDINILKPISSFWQSSEQSRYRVLFGFGFNNIAAEYSMSSILLSIFMIRNLNRNEKSYLLKATAFWLLDAVMVLIIICNNSRGTFIALLFVVLMLLLFRIFKRFSFKLLFKRLFVLLLIVVAGFVVYLISNGITFIDLLNISNRAHFLNNIEAMRNGNKWLMGLGNISGQYFREQNVLYGVKLDYMETYYVGVFVTSGIIGSIWIFTLIVVIFRSIFIQKRTKFTSWLLIVFFYMLFLSIFEGYLFSSSYITSTFFLLVIVTYISQRRPQFKPAKSKVIRKKTVQINKIEKSNA